MQYYKLSFSTSALIHVVAIGFLGLWVPREVRHATEYAVVRGEPITLAITSPPLSEPTEPDFVVRGELMSVTSEIPPVPQPLKVEIARQFPTPHSMTLRTELDPTTQPVSVSPAVNHRRNPTDNPSDRPVEVVLAPPTPVRRKTDAPTPKHAMDVPWLTAATTGAKADQLPRKLPTNRPPSYPADALLEGVEGRVMILVSIHSDGTVTSARVSTSSGSASLDEAAILAVRQWQFEPARRSGRAIAYQVFVPVKFSINRG